MTYRIRTTKRAEADIERLHASIVERRDEDAARDWYEAYCIAVERLLSMPLSCGLAYENPRFNEELRHLLHGFAVPSLVFCFRSTRSPWDFVTQKG